MSIDYEHSTHLTALHKQASQAETTTGAAYLSCVMGMWAHTYGVAYNHNPYVNGTTDRMITMSSWWNTGWNASFGTFKNLNKLALVKKKK
jgi:hypothetical protein